MASRSQVRDYNNLFFTPISVYETEVSASSGVSLLTPASGQFLEVWQIALDGRSSNTIPTGVFLRDGATGSVLRFIEVAVGETKVIDFASYPQKFTSAVWLQTVGQSVRATVNYFARKTLS